MEIYLKTSEIIDWNNPAIVELANTLALNQSGPMAIARSCFEWVRDEIRHSYDYQMNPVTCRASDVLRHKTGVLLRQKSLVSGIAEGQWNSCWALLSASKS